MSALALLLGFGGAGIAPAAEPGDDPASWDAARREISQLGDGFIVWESLRTGAWRIFTIRLDGTGLRQLTKDEPGRDHYCPKLSPDGKRLVYLSLPDEAQKNNLDRPRDMQGQLHLLNADGSGDHVILEGAQKYNGWDRAVTWFSNDELACIGPDSNAYRLNLASGVKELLIKGGGCWLPNTKLTHAVWSFNTFSLLDAKTQTVTPMPHLGGCQPYFTHDGDWGYWMRAPGGPIYKMRLSTRAISGLFWGEGLPAHRNYYYFPMVSVNQRLLAFAAVDHSHIIGAYGGYVLSDYDIFLVQLEPKTLEVIGTPVRYSFDPKCDRFPDVWQAEPALGFHADKAPFAVALRTADMTGAWDWNYGDGTPAKAGDGQHSYTKPGVYLVEARQGDQLRRGQVRVAPAKAPQAVACIVENERELLVTFGEPVSLKAMSATLLSQARVEKHAPGEDGRSVRLWLAAKLTHEDTLLLDGITDVAQRPNPMAPARLAVVPRTWPSNPDGLVFLWETADKTNRLRDPVTNDIRAYTAKVNDAAHYDRDRAMVPDGGSFYIEGFNDQLSNAVRKSNELSIEFTLTPARIDGDGAGCVLSYGVSQVKDKLVLALQGAKTELCTLVPGRTVHVVITYLPEHLACYVDGEQVLSTDKVRGDLSGFPTGPITVGNNLDGQPWLGTMEGIAFYNRVLNPPEVQANGRAYRAIRTGRKPAERLQGEARLVASSKTPTLAEIAPYRQALVVNEYEVLKVAAGKYVPKRLRVAHWGILDGAARPVTELPVGATVTLTAEPIASQPQLDGQKILDTLPEDMDLPVYYAVSATLPDYWLREWSAFGCYPPEVKDVMAWADPVEGKTGLPAKHALSAGQAWRVLKPDAAGYLNLHVLPHGGLGCGFAVTRVVAPSALDAVLRLGTVGALKAWLNGTEVTAGSFGRYPFLGWRDVPVKLKRGENEVLIKTTQQYAFWGFAAVLLTPDGKAMPDLANPGVAP